MFKKIVKFIKSLWPPVKTNNQAIDDFIERSKGSEKTYEVILKKPTEQEIKDRVLTVEVVIYPEPQPVPVKLHVAAQTVIGINRSAENRNFSKVTEPLDWPKQ